MYAVNVCLRVLFACAVCVQPFEKGINTGLNMENQNLNELVRAAKERAQRAKAALESAKEKAELIRAPTLVLGSAWPCVNCVCLKYMAHNMNVCSFFIVLCCQG